MNKKKDKDSLPQYMPLQGPFFDMRIMDPMGSYTGVPLPEFEEPVQDADDL